MLDLFDEQAERDVIKNMIGLAKLKTESSACVQAATWLWDRKYGKVKEQVELSGEVAVKGYTVKEVSPDAWDDPDDPAS